MQSYEYKVVPAPTRGEKERNAKTTADRFGVALTNLMNSMAREGWEYQRADTLPCDERVGFTGKATVFQNMLVFRRTLEVTLQNAMPTLNLAQSGMVSAVAVVPDAAFPRLGAAEVPAGPAPAVGPVRPELAAE
jgi:hypothetical protein